jgi:hypothetical protein
MAYGFNLIYKRIASQKKYIIWKKKKERMPDENKLP